MKPVATFLPCCSQLQRRPPNTWRRRLFSYRGRFRPVSGGTIVWVAGQTATQDTQGTNIANNFEAQVKQVFSQIDGVLKRAGGSLDNVVTMTVFIKESRYGDKFVEMRKDYFKDGNYPGSALITVTNFARPGIEIEIQAVGVIGDACSKDNPCSAEAKVKKTEK